MLDKDNISTEIKPLIWVSDCGSHHLGTSIVEYNLRISKEK